MEVLRRFWGGYVLSLKVISGALLALIFVLTLGNMAARLLFDIATPGVEEALRFTLLWFTLVAAALGAALSSHLAVTEIAAVLPDPVRRVLGAFVVLAGLVFAGWLVRGGLQQRELSAQRTSASLGLPLADVLVILPLAGVLLIVSILGAAVFGKDPEGQEIADEAGSL